MIDELASAAVQPELFPSLFQKLPTQAQYLALFAGLR
jgi:hypothetical protein